MDKKKPLLADAAKYGAHVEDNIRPDDWRELSRNIKKAAGADIRRAFRIAWYLELMATYRVANSPVGDFWRDLKSDSRELARDSHRIWIITHNAFREAPYVFSRRISSLRTGSWISSPQGEDDLLHSDYNFEFDKTLVVADLIATAGRSTFEAIRDASRTVQSRIAAVRMKPQVESPKKPQEPPVPEDRTERRDAFEILRGDEAPAPKGAAEISGVSRFSPDLDKYLQEQVSSDRASPYQLWLEYHYVDRSVLALSRLANAIRIKRVEVASIDKFDEIAVALAQNKDAGVYFYRLIEGDPNDPENIGLNTYIGKAVALETAQQDAWGKIAQLAAETQAAPYTADKSKQLMGIACLIRDLGNWREEGYTTVVKTSLFGKDMLTPIKDDGPHLRPTVLDLDGSVTQPFGEPDETPKPKMYAELLCIDNRGKKHSHHERVNSEQAALAAALRRATSPQPDVYGYRIWTIENGKSTTGPNIYFGKVYDVAITAAMVPGNRQLQDLVGVAEFAVRADLQRNITNYQELKPGDMVRDFDGNITMPLVKEQDPTAPGNNGRATIPTGSRPHT